MPSQGWDRREYDHERYLRIKAHLIKMLGGSCVECGLSDFDELEFDHAERETKKYNVTSLWNRPNLLEEELKKVRLLCYDCHKARTKAQFAVEHGGGVSGRKACPCELCRAQKAAYMRARRAAAKAASQSAGEPAPPAP